MKKAIKRLFSGFTLIEVFVVFAAISTLATLGIIAFNSYDNVQVFQSSVADITTMLSKARSRSVSQVKPPECEGKILSGYEVSFDIVNSDYTLSALCGEIKYALETKSLPSQVRFLEGTAATVLFDVSTGGVSALANIILSGSGNTKSISVGTNGGISLSGSDATMIWERLLRKF